MKRFLLAALVGLLVGQFAFAPAFAVDYKSNIGTQDLNLDGDGAAHGTFQRRTSTGGVLTLDKIDGNQIPWSSAYTGVIRPLNITGKSSAPGRIQNYFFGSTSYTDNGFFGEITGNPSSHGTIQNYNFGSASYTDNGYFSDLITKGPYIDVRAYGSGSVTLAALQAAVNAALGKTVRVPSGAYSFDNSVTLPDNAVFLDLTGVTITQTGGVPTFLKTNHSYTEIRGGDLRGNGNGFKYLATPGGQRTSLRMYGTRFAVDNGVYGLYLDGANEPFFDGIDISGPGNGVYLVRTVSPVFQNGTWRGTGETGTAFFYDGAHGYSAGPVLRFVEIMGWEYGVRIANVDWCYITGCPIDFNRYSLYFEGQDGGEIIGNYIGNSAYPGYGFSDPAVTLKSGYLDNATKNMTFAFNTILNHWELDNTSNNVYITGAATAIKFAYNQVTFWTQYGFEIDNAVVLELSHNYFAPRSGFGVNSIHRTGSVSDSNFLITSNTLNASFPISGMTYAMLRDNPGHMTRWSGVVATDNASTSWQVTHNLGTTPTVITVSADANHPVWYDNVSSTGFTVYTDNTYTPIFNISWTAEKPQGN